MANDMKPDACTGLLSVRRFRGCDSMLNRDFELYEDLPDGDYHLYRADHPAVRALVEAAHFAFNTLSSSLYQADDQGMAFMGDASHEAHVLLRKALAAFATLHPASRKETQT
jgi:hypothetical protein